jgi:hypothetical protein
MRDGEITIDSSDDRDAMWMDVWHYESARHVITQASIAVGIPRDEIRAGQPVLYDEMRPGLTQQTFRLLDMDVAGIEASLCFPNTFVRFCGQRFLWGRDKALAALCVEAYNDYVIEEWADGSGGRLIPVRDHAPLGSGARRSRGTARRRSRRARRRLLRTSFSDAFGLRSLDAIGVDNVMFETDYPHPTSLCPGPVSQALPAAEHIATYFKDLPADVVRKVLHDNAARLYRVD